MKGIFLKLVFVVAISVAATWVGYRLPLFGSGVANGEQGQDVAESQSQAEDLETVSLVSRGEGEYFARHCFERLKDADELRSTFDTHLQACGAIRELSVSEYGILDRMLAKGGLKEAGLFRLILNLRWLEIDQEDYYDHLSRLFPKDRSDWVLQMTQDYAGLADKSTGDSLAGYIQELKKRDDEEKTHEGLAEKRDALRQAIFDKTWEHGDRNQFFQDFSEFSRYSYAEALSLLKGVDNPSVLIQCFSRLRYQSGTYSIEGLEALTDLKDRGRLGLGELYQNAISQLLAIANGSDRLEGLRWARDHMSDYEFVALLGARNPLRNIDGDRVAEVLGMIKELPYSKMRDDSVRNVLRDYVQKDWKQAARLIDEHLPLDGQVNSQLIRAAYQAGHLEEALTRLEQYQGSPQFNQMVEGLEHSWGQQNPSEYVEWALTHLEGRGLQNGIDGVANIWMQKDPDGVGAFVQLLPEGDLKDGFVTTLGTTLAYRDPLAGLEYALTVQSERPRMQIMSQAISRWSAEEPMAAMEFLADADFIQEQYLSNLVQNVASSWANRNIAEAVQYIEDIENKNVRDQAMLTLAPNYFSLDRESGLEMIRGIPSGDRRDHMLRQLLNVQRYRQYGQKTNEYPEEIREELYALVESEGTRQLIEADEKRGIQW